MVNRILTPRELLIGGGSLAQLPALLARLGVTRPLLVIDPTILRLGLADAPWPRWRRRGGRAWCFPMWWRTRPTSPCWPPQPSSGRRRAMA